MLDEGTLYTRVDLDMLLLNVEVAVKVSRRTEFFAWVQGVFQSAIGHDALICGLALPDVSGLRYEWLGGYPISEERFAEICDVDHGLMHRAIRGWHEGGGAPLLVNPANRDARDGAATDLADTLRRLQLDNLIAHGLPGLDGRPAGFFALCNLRIAPAERELRMLAMLMPYLYAGWLRANCDASGELRQRDREPTLTQREIEILDWMQKGKSNSEIAGVLGISHLTVKNHVQRVLRKLDASNRTEAVAKGMSLTTGRGGIGRI